MKNVHFEPWYTPLHQLLDELHALLQHVHKHGSLRIRKHASPELDNTLSKSVVNLALRELDLRPLQERRDDLAVEPGSVRMAEVQEEILWLCEAAHVPVIWATQVLESIAKHGVRSRPEFTDAAMGVRAECVMLNKGPYILEAMRSLNAVLQRMQDQQRKKISRLRALHW